MELRTQEFDLRNSSDITVFSEFDRAGPLRQALRTIRSSKTAMCGAVIVVVMLIFAVIGPMIAPYNPTRQNLLHRNESVSITHPAGTDQYGRDIASRMLHGARISLSLSLGAIGLALLGGIPIGLISGQKGGLLDIVVVGLVDILLTFPTFLLAIFVVAVTGPSTNNIMIAIAISTLPRFTRIVRGDVLGVASSEFVLGALSIGAGAWRIVFRHILPNVLSSIAVVASIELGGAILVEASLSFLGLGLSPPTPAWGLMINEGLRFLDVNPLIAIVPGVAIALTVLGFNLLGDGLRDALDPRLRGGVD